MGKLITVSGRTLLLSGQSPPTLNYQVVETDIQATKTRGNKKPILIQQIKLDCTCFGSYSVTTTFSGTGSAVIVASSTTVKCENQPILLAGDQVTITCSGTITETSTGATSSGTASVTVTVSNTNQTNIFAS
ncbi:MULTISPECIES: hypothetical protein [unclassified Anabaena]|uniref:hypothetical protein n=1 Tax=unclassified Anabaena TaxID=2619674 RepID=UPI00082AAC3A|nr:MULTISPECIES: hypothetical protein [unclassified Anabaena]